MTNVVRERINQWALPGGTRQTVHDSDIRQGLSEVKGFSFVAVYVGCTEQKDADQPALSTTPVPRHRVRVQSTPCWLDCFQYSSFPSPLFFTSLFAMCGRTYRPSGPSNTRDYLCTSTGKWFMCMKGLVGITLIINLGHWMSDMG